MVVVWRGAKSVATKWRPRTRGINGGGGGGGGGE